MKIKRSKTVAEGKINTEKQITALNEKSGLSGVLPKAEVIPEGDVSRGADFYYDDPELEFLFTADLDTSKIDDDSFLDTGSKSYVPSLSVDDVHERIEKSMDRSHMEEIRKLKQRIKELES